MAVRLGVDVGGTFTKAVAVDAYTGSLVARAVVPTTHRAARGIAEGVVRSIELVKQEVERAGLDPIVLVGHSTSLAVNALLEGDLPTVGLIGIGRAPDVGAARKRTELREIALAPGRVLIPRYRFLDATAGLSAATVEATIDALVAEGIAAIAVSEAFSVDDPRGERFVLEAAARRGLPACAGHELTGLLGLELRTISAVMNAAILPRARLTADVVAAGLADAGIDAPLVILRGDGGATDLAGFAAAPLRSLFSGPAASVAGALHELAIPDGAVVEVGGTSSNICLIKDGRPRLAYVRIGERATALRSVDVWVAGVAGGSLARMRARKVVAVGPRSAHIAGLPYASFADPSVFSEGAAILIAPRPGDAADHLALDTPSGRYALTVTDAANASGRVARGSTAEGSHEAARRAFELAGRTLGVDGRRLADDVLSLAASSLLGTLRAAARSAGIDLRRAPILGVGGGAGALVPAVAAAARATWTLAPHADVLSSLGAAGSLIQAQVERSAEGMGPADVAAMIREAEAAAIASGAAPASVEVRTENDVDRGAIRAIATGSLPLQAGFDAQTAPIEPAERRTRAATYLGIDAGRLVELGEIGPYRAFAEPLRKDKRQRWALVDARGGLAHLGDAERLLISNGRPGFRDEAVLAVRRSERHVGPASVAPSVVVVAGRRIVDYSSLTTVAAVTDGVTAELERAEAEGERPTIVAIEREAG